MPSRLERLTREVTDGAGLVDLPLGGTGRLDALGTGRAIGRQFGVPPLLLRCVLTVGRVAVGNSHGGIPQTCPVAGAVLSRAPGAAAHSTRLGLFTSPTALARKPLMTERAAGMDARPA